MNITTVKLSAGSYDVLVNGEHFDTVTRNGKRWLADGDSTVAATTLAKALDSVVWNAICQTHGKVTHLAKRASHFRHVKHNPYMADLFNVRHFVTAKHVFDKVRPNV